MNLLGFADLRPTAAPTDAPSGTQSHSIGSISNRAFARPGGKISFPWTPASIFFCRGRSNTSTKIVSVTARETMLEEPEQFDASHTEKTFRRRPPLNRTVK